MSEHPDLHHIDGCGRDVGSNCYLDSRFRGLPDYSLGCDRGLGSSLQLLGYLQVARVREAQQRLPCD